MEYRLTELCKRTRHIYRTEGLISLLKRVFTFLLPHFFQYRNYYLWEIDISKLLKERNEADFMPTTQNFTFKIVATNEQADKLAAEGLEFRSHILNARRSLDKGAIAFCLFFGNELASIRWMAMSVEARKSLNRLPYRVDFSNNIAYVSGIMTKPKYWGMGFAPYVAYKSWQFMKEMGIEAYRTETAKNNIQVQRLLAKYTTNPHAEARQLKILWWNSWKEKPLIPVSVHGNSSQASPQSIP
jgi:RimJ/RimL family protein N-acetyltransferase